MLHLFEGSCQKKMLSSLLNGMLAPLSRKLPKENVDISLTRNVGILFKEFSERKCWHLSYTDAISLLPLSGKGQAVSATEKYNCKTIAFLSRVSKSNVIR